MKKQLSIIGGSIAGFWSALTDIRQNHAMQAISLITEQNNKPGNFLTQLNNELANKRTDSFPDQFNHHLTHNDSPSSEEMHASLTHDMDWIDEDTSQGGEFLDDALRLKDQPLGLLK